MRYRSARLAVNRASSVAIYGFLAAVNCLSSVSQFGHGDQAKARGFGLDHQETRAIVRDVEILFVASVEQRLPRHRRGAPDRARASPTSGASLPEVDPLSVGRPDRAPPAADGDLDPAAGRRKRSDIHLETSRFVGLVRDRMSVGRESSVRFRRLPVTRRDRALRASSRARGLEIERAVVKRVERHDVAVRRQIDVPRIVPGLADLDGWTAAIGWLPPERGAPALRRHVENAAAVRRPGRVSRASPVVSGVSVAGGDVEDPEVGRARRGDRERDALARRARGARGGTRATRPTRDVRRRCGRPRPAADSIVPCANTSPPPCVRNAFASPPLPSQTRIESCTGVAVADARRCPTSNGTAIAMPSARTYTRRRPTTPSALAPRMPSGMTLPSSSDAAAISRRSTAPYQNGEENRLAVGEDARPLVAQLFARRIDVREWHERAACRIHAEQPVAALHDARRRPRCRRSTTSRCRHCPATSAEHDGRATVERNPHRFCRREMNAIDLPSGENTGATRSRCQESRAT